MHSNRNLHAVHMRVLLRAQPLATLQRSNSREQPISSSALELLRRLGYYSPMHSHFQQFAVAASQSLIGSLLSLGLSLTLLRTQRK